MNLTLRWKHGGVVCRASDVTGHDVANARRCGGVRQSATAIACSSRLRNRHVLGASASRRCRVTNGSIVCVVHVSVAVVKLCVVLSPRICTYAHPPNVDAQRGGNAHHNSRTFVSDVRVKLAGIVVVVVHSPVGRNLYVGERGRRYSARA